MAYRSTASISILVTIPYTDKAQKVKFSLKAFYGKCEEIRINF